MCGIVGLHLRNADLHPRLGELLAGMLCEMEDRGADSAGIAVYGDPVWTPAGRGAVSLIDVEDTGEQVADRLTTELGGTVDVTVLGTTYLLTADVDSAVLLAAARTAFPRALVGGFGADLAVLKGVGGPRALADGWGLAQAQGWQGVGHTRMATESAVTSSGAHPYAVGPGQCLVHNGSFSNHATIRRRLMAAGVEFDSLNDTEVGARFVAHRLEAGQDVASALTELCATFDGFYTLLVADRDSFAVVRDAIACKPAVIAETDDWVAMASEFRALAHLPGVEHARIWEPEPETVYAWSRRGGPGVTTTYDLVRTSLREVNAALHAKDVAGEFVIEHPFGAHSVAAGVDAPVRITIDGHVGYYAAGMNQQAEVVIDGNAGTGVAENMMSGSVHVRGNASQSAGATAHGGLLVIDGDAAARCGISMKGVDIVVGGSIGHNSAFMAQAGRLVVRGDAGEGLGDSIYEARVYVRGTVAALGADCVAKPMEAEHLDELAGLLKAAGFEDDDPASYTRYGSARRLYHFHVDNASAY